ncbi:hypothetical protein QA640_32365 [Bradyrhizobium sp. CB82]|uniref:DUF6894 family protein n=1 Tax=Bradyrhizobium sp. CB82 TaxID=3039159 RepID=UPI0024B22C92|nr:hypothetical protein [Bradyrhizobium sp. CB82]WFU39053.1 hypothetical protein QA640_32365 [Bradyrhizobium sp. CB82]
MPRFHFHILNGKNLYDDDGIELADIEAAKIEAVRVAGTVLGEGLPPDFWWGTAWEMVVKDTPELQSGRTFFTLTFSATEEPSK